MITLPGLPKIVSGEPIRFYIDNVSILKGETPQAKGNTKKPMRLGGIASTNALDLDGMVLEPKGFHLDYLLTTGFVNWHHGFGHPKTIIGEILKAEIKNNQLHVETELYDWQPLSHDVYHLAKGLVDNKQKRRLAWSVEGFPIEVDSEDENHVLKMFITGLAITPMPKNATSFVDVIVKGMNPLAIDGWKEEFDFDQNGNIFEVGQYCVDGKCEIINKGMTTQNIRPLMRESLEKKFSNIATTFRQKFDKALLILRACHELGMISDKEVKKISKAIKKGNLNFKALEKL